MSSLSHGSNKCLDWRQMDVLVHEGVSPLIQESCSVQFRLNADWLKSDGKGTTPRVHHEQEKCEVTFLKIYHEKHRWWLQWIIFTVFNTRVHHSSLYVITLLFSASGKMTNNNTSRKPTDQLFVTAVLILTENWFSVSQSKMSFSFSHNLESEILLV